MIDITVKIGGEAGQGIQTVGNLLALACRESGLFIMAINDFESRIRGGHSFFQMRISDRPVQAPHHVVDLLVALNRETHDLHREELSQDGMVLMDFKKQTNDDTGKGTRVEVLFSDLAKQAGGPIYANTVAAAACLSILGASMDLVKTILSRQFAGKSDDVLDRNLAAAALGFKAVRGVSIKTAPLSGTAAPLGFILEGSRAVALGAVAADCRVAAFYPMSPATSIMGHLIALAGHLPLVVEQAEDEIAAVNMVIGASFAGARAMTATSGGGFCLMTEGLGLAAITETPIVIVDAQRPGPATGLPTRTGQGDLQFVIHASQDDFPRFVFAPGNSEEAFHITVKAFQLSEKFQVPAIILLDQYLADSMFLVEKPFTAQATVPRFIARDTDLDNPGNYRRFALAESGISPRAIPCNGEALVVISSDEHTEDGHITEEIDHRIAMVDKRKAKLPAMTREMSSPAGYHAGAELLLICWGSTQGAVMEAVDGMRARGMDAGCVHFTDLWPFPADAAVSLLSGARKAIYMVEQNSTAQFGRLLKEQTGIAFTHAVLKYDGRPFYPNDIIDAVIRQEE
ncbi:MAG: 2-oxoacid:acceptor oxidoreductase subunit alpha [Pseudomonadota bacterium]